MLFRIGISGKQHRGLAHATLAIGIGLLATGAVWTPRASGDDLRCTEQNNQITVQYNNHPILVYQAAPHPYKVYVSQLFTPSGLQILRDSPHDHVHHHALMLAIGINGIDCWAEFGEDKNGKQIPRSTATSSTLTDGRGTANIRQSITWTAPDHKALAEEDRRITVHVGQSKDVTLLSWFSELRPAGDAASAELWGRHYFGLGMRFIEAMDNNGHFINASDAKPKPVRGSETLVRANWCAYIATAGARKVTVAMFDAPGNTRHPATWFTMNRPFAYLSATIDLKSKPLTITRDKPFRARYGVAVWDGAVSRDTIQKVYQQWLGLQ